MHANNDLLISKLKGKTILPYLYELQITNCDLKMK